MTAVPTLIGIAQSKGRTRLPDAQRVKGSETSRQMLARKREVHVRVAGEAASGAAGTEAVEEELGDAIG